MYTEDDCIQIAALQHFVYCPRQCALIHVEDAWKDNVFTVGGNILHEKVDTDTYESRGALRTVRGLRIQSLRLGIVGRADVVEFRPPELRNEEYSVLPVEFKFGQQKEDISDKVQLCAQALCLEEMVHVTITKGAFYYGRIHHRVVIPIDNELRRQTEEIIRKVQDMMATKNVPIAQFSVKCRNCSLADICLPKAMNTPKLDRYMKDLYEP
jgi:CRISPR-associated exonuclease Cas4